MEDEVERASDKTYAPIGRFVVEFEYLTDAIRDVAVLTFKKHGLTKESLARIVLSGLTATPLLVVFKSLVSESLELDPTQRDLVNQIAAKGHALIRYRNQIVHGTWHWIDFARFPVEPLEGIVQTAHRKRHRLQDNWHSFKPGELDKLVKEVAATRELVGRFRSSLDKAGADS